MILDYEILRLIWWLLLGVLLIGFAVMDGFDLGVAALLPFVAKKDVERRVVINTVGPVWEGNQVWFILGGGAIFAAWPMLYAVSFSGFYLAMFLVLCALILRPVGFKFRSKVDDKTWRQIWDMCLFIGGVVPSIVFGVAVGNVLLGVPFHFDDTLRSFYTGTFWQLLNPFGLYCGVTSLCMLVMHGSTYLVLKTEKKVQTRTLLAGQIFALLTFILFLGGGYIVAGLDGYVITSEIVTDAASNPLSKTVAKVPGAWLNNYHTYPWMVLAPLIGLIGSLKAFAFLRMKKFGFAFVASGFSVAGIISTVGVSIFPMFLPSSTDLNSSLTVWDASSSEITLLAMTVASVIFVPIIIAYTSWVYKVMAGTVTEKHILENEKEVY